MLAILIVFYSAWLLTKEKTIGILEKTGLILLKNGLSFWNITKEEGNHIRVIQQVGVKQTESVKDHIKLCSSENSIYLQNVKSRMIPSKHRRRSLRFKRHTCETSSPYINVHQSIRRDLLIYLDFNLVICRWKKKSDVVRSWRWNECIIAYYLRTYDRVLTRKKIYWN